MKTRVLTCLLAAAALLAFSGSAFAAGFGLYEWSARGNAMGGAMTSHVDDASGMAYNIAGITQLDNWHGMTGVTAITPRNSVKTTDGGGTTTTNDPDIITWYSPHFYAAGPVTDKLSIGVGSFSRFGLGVYYEDDWDGRYSGYSAKLVTASIVPGVAYKLSDKFSVGVGVELMHFNIGLEKKVATAGTPATDIDSYVEGDSVGIGYNIGVQYRPNDQWSLGAQYRSQMQIDIQGEADFTVPTAVAGAPVPGGGGATFAQAFADTDATGYITLPDSVHLGISYKPVERLRLAAEAIFTRWSTYDELRIEFESALPDSAPQKNYNDVWRLAIGAEYDINEYLTARAGYTYDESPIEDGFEDYLVASNDRRLFSLGLGAKYENWIFDAGYTYLWVKGRDVAARPAEGVVESRFQKGDTHIIALSVGYAF